ncbi:hypothetical protein NE236_18300 [Actinoallomurus purpureus]|uniref:WXG100 family type VII secretion target n=1 Tax=Actinoallomurus purpureus TaxID=478114 RepID=UPI002091E73D|nr:hypothetical protein [Actinoallomurus purpureus]MCO6006942.1 hypothetical protein [Actinoallomurus purpureus]
MGLTVDVVGLREAADTYVKYGDEFKTQVQPGVVQGSLPWTAFPLVDMGFKDAYSQAWEALDLSTHALGDVLTTIGLALTRVANHYQNMEAENTKLFGGKPITAPSSPLAHSMNTAPSGGQIVSGAVVGGGAVASVVFSSMGLLQASLPFGVSFIVIEGSLISAAVLNLRDPVPFFTAAEGWGDVRGVLNVAAAKVPQLMNNVVYRGKWEGDGKDAFYACINNDIGPAMAAMKDLNNDMQIACRDAAIALGLSVISYVAGTVTAATICETANAAGATGVGAPAAATTVNITLASWITFASELFVDLATVVGGLVLAASTISQGYDTLKAFLGTKGNTLEAGSISLRSSELQTMQDWEHGWKDPGMQK